MKQSPGRRRLAYSSERPVCPRCGWRLSECRCAGGPEEAVPDRVTAKLRIEKAGRGGKTVTVVYDLPRNRSFLKGLCKELKTACGGGGKAGETTVEIQGDHRDKLRSLLRDKGWQVKG